MGNNDSLDILLRILLDKGAVRDFENGTGNIEDALKGVDQESLKLAETFANTLDKSLKKLDSDFAKTRKEIEETKKSAAALAQISQTIFVAGSAIVGSMYLAAKTEADRVIKEGGELDATTARWLAANERIQASQQSIGRSAEIAFLPVLEQAAELAERAASVIEDNPELVSAALKIGVWMVGIGALGSLASKGIKLLADIKYLTASSQQTAAAAAMNLAAKTQFEAALLMQGGKGGVVGGLGSAAQKILPLGGAAAGGEGVAAVATGALALIGSVLGGIFAGGAITDMINKEGIDAGTADTSLTTVKKGLVVWGQLMPAALEKLGWMSTETRAKIFELQKGILGLNESSEVAVAKIAKIAADEATAQEAMVKMEEDNIKAEKKYSDDRSNILDDATKALSDSNKKMNASLSDIAANLDKTISKINTDANKASAKEDANFKDANAKAAKDYQKKQADIEKQGSDSILKIHQQAQKDLEQLEKDHAQRVSDLTEARDALGLFKEQQAYTDKKSEINQGVDQATQQARAETQARLAEAAAGYAEERAQRQEEYNKKKAEDQQQRLEAIREAQAQAAEAKAKAIAAQKEEAAKIEADRVEKLSSLEKNFNDERSARAVAAYNQIKDLGGALNAERAMRLQYQGAILADATAHMQALQRVQASLGTVGGKTTTPTHDYSGYAFSGLYNMAQDGQRQYVLSGAATSAAEQMVGGQLNQQAILSGLAGGGGGRNYYDYRTFCAVTAQDMHKIQEMSQREAMNVLDNSLQGD